MKDSVHEPRPIGDAWGGPGASWLAEVLARAKQRDLTLPDDPGPERRAPTVGKLDHTPDFEQDHAGVVAVRWFDGFAHEVFTTMGPPLLIMGALFAVFAGTGDPASGPVFTWVVPVALLLILMVQMVRHRRKTHRVVGIDTRTLHYVESGRRREVRLEDIVAVHLALDAVQVDLRDGSAVTVGHGWSTKGLRELRDRLDEARRSAHPDAVGTTDDVPAGLAELRRASRAEREA